MVFDPFIIKCSTFFKLQTADYRTHMSFLQLQCNGFRYSIQSEGKTFNILQVAEDDATSRNNAVTVL